MSKNSKQSFSRGRKWVIACQVFFIVLVMFSIVVMVNYLAGGYFHRFHWSSLQKNQLSPQTLRLVQSLTNQVKVTIYYDREEPFFNTVHSLLKEYRYANPKIAIETVDYLRDPVAAQRVKAQHKLVFSTQTNIVIFDSGGKTYGVDGNLLTQYTFEQIPNEQQRVFQKKAVAFEGEKAFSAALLAVCNPKPLTAYYLEGHGEHPLLSGDTNTSYGTFKGILEQNCIEPVELHSLLGSNTVPPGDCNLLVVAGPRTALKEIELEKIDRYLAQGGRMLALFNSVSGAKETGLERILRQWGVEVGKTRIKDPQHSQDAARPMDIATTSFSPTHPMVNALAAQRLPVDFYDPRPVGKVDKKDSAADAPKVEEIVFSSRNSYAEGDEERKQAYPLVVAVEKGDSKGIIRSTRIVVAGDSIFLDNEMIESGANRDFAGFILNWLLDRTQLLEGVGPRQVVKHQVLLPAAQSAKVKWALLAGMPGTALTLGGLVWLRRRK